MPEDTIAFDTILPTPFVQGLVRAAVLNGIAVDEVLISEGIALDKTNGLPISKIARIVNFLIEMSPFTTIFPIMRVFNDEAIVEMLAISSASRNLCEATKNLLACGPFSAVGLDANYQIGGIADYYEVRLANHEGLSRFFLIKIFMAAFVRCLPSQFQAPSVLEGVEFEFDLKGNRIEYEAFFGCPVLFNQSGNRIQLKKNIINVDIQSHSPNLLESAMNILQSKTDTLLALQGYRFKVSQIVRRLITKRVEQFGVGHDLTYKNDLSLEKVASDLGINSRALQRKLKLEKCSFVDCKNQVLIDESKKWIDQGQSNLDILAETFGYSDRAAFSKVFKKYEGIWPAQYKEK